jgi:hypothetical protein
MKFSLSINKHHNKKNYKIMEEQLHPFLTSALYGDKRPVSHAARFTSSETASSAHRKVGMLRPTADPDTIHKDTDALSLSKIELRYLSQVAARSKITTY